ncbi:hypothetical protein HDE_00407 [Halotydeus destructor]|nr:hypothetical protein HDE_00407 [Halotydeus destructor]
MSNASEANTTELFAWTEIMLTNTSNTTTRTIDDDYRPPVAKPEEIIIVVIVLFIWGSVIFLFVHKWSKIQGIEPYIPAFERPPSIASFSRASSTRSRDFRRTSKPLIPTASETERSPEHKKPPNNSRAYRPISHGLSEQLMTSKYYRKKSQDKDNNAKAADNVSV